MTTYLDNAATTRPSPSVVAAIRLALEECWANPSSSHAPGLAARSVLEKARESVAAACRIPASGVVFTSGGTEANQLAALGLPMRSRTTRVVTTEVEHPSLGRSLAARAGVELVKARVTPSGAVDLDHFASLLDERVGLVALFDGHNETGARNPIADVVALTRSKAPRALVHVDSVQSFGKPNPPPFDLGVDSASVSAHKIHGPKGVGALLLATRSTITPQLLGGGQESDRRSGTENVPGIAGFGEAVALVAQLTHADHARMRERRERLERELLRSIPDARVLVSGPAALPHVVALVVPGAPAEVLLHHLERAEVVVSAGAACHSTSRQLSPALRALGLADDEIRSTLRLSLARTTTDAEIDHVLSVLPAIVRDARALGAVR